MFELDFLLIELGLLAGDGDVSMLNSKIESRNGGVSISDSRLKALNEVAMGIIILFLPGIEPQIADSVDSLRNIRNGRGIARNGECAELRRDLETPCQRQGNPELVGSTKVPYSSFQGQTRKRDRGRTE